MTHWKSKLELTARPLRLGLLQNGNLMTFGDLTGPDGTGAPRLHIRSMLIRNPLVVHEFELSAFADPAATPTLNAQRVWQAADFTNLQPGVYQCEVRASLSGQQVIFPESGHFVIEWQAPLNRVTP